VVTLPTGRAQQPNPDNDKRAPLPFEQPQNNQQPAAKDFQIPNPDLDHFQKIQDDTPLQSETQNEAEYRAYNAVIAHARQFTAAELEQHANRTLVRDDLTQRASRGQFRLELVRFEGKFTRFRKVRLTRALAESDPWLSRAAELASAELGLTVSADALGATGVKGVYQGWLVPAGEPASRPVCVMFTDLPPGISPPPELDQWVSVDRWAAFAGYSFKLLSYPGPDADPKNPRSGGWLSAPLLIGVSFTLISEPAPEIKLNKNLRIFREIADDAPMTDVKPTGEKWEEFEAWQRVLLHAREFSPEQLDQAARRDVSFADLFKEGRRDYKLDLVRFEGRLVRVKPMATNRRLQEAGVNTVYEGWLIPQGEPAGNPICIVISELPEGLELPENGKLMNRWVAFAGYSFKLMRYESQEKDQDEKNKWKRAPLLIGRTVIPLDTPENGSSPWLTTFVPVVGGGILLLAGIGLALTWWFRRGDRRALNEINNVRQRNPFES
jgi:hypothetical protein